MATRARRYDADEGFRRLAARVRAARGEEQPIRVLIADDHHLFAESLAVMLEAGGDIEVIGHAADGREAATLSGLLRPDVVLMDLDMPIMDGITATRAVLTLSSRTRVVIVTGSTNPDDEQRAREAGARAFLHKANSVESVRREVFEAASRVVTLGSARRRRRTDGCQDDELRTPSV